MEHSRALQEWQNLNSAPRSDMEFMFLRRLQETYPQHIVTRINPGECDVIGFADADLASAIRDDKAENHTVESFRGPISRLQEESGILTEDIKFGRWLYKWDETEYIVYQIKYEVPFRPPQRSVYVLSQKAVNDDGEVTEHYNSRTDALLLAVGKWSRELHDEIYVFDDQAWAKDKKLWESVKNSSWDDVILNPAMKHNLISDVQGFFDAQSLYKKLAVPWKRGIILHGVPGNGKTISIKALINSLHIRSPSVPSLYVKSFDGDCHGPKWSIHEIFKQARMMAPCLLIFEDLDSLVTPKTRSYFLNEVDGLEDNDGILMVGSTNYLSKLDPSISKRPSRFDRKYHFKLPSEEERRAYCMFWREKLLNNDMIEFPEDVCPIIAKLTEGFSFAYLKELFVISLLGIARKAAETSEARDTGSSASTDDGIVVEKEETLEEFKDGIAAATDEKVEKRVIPEVDIPAHLKDNELLKAVAVQAKMLLEEMESTDDELAAVPQGQDVHNIAGMCAAE
ncbi:proteasome-activating nucleotidase protein [Rutstroemia sp. NJR-2017a BVV2]|nr:proteasome-activating nucleotidase protein [Rutstroemia sp. NJR-2017a BVV2]